MNNEKQEQELFPLDEFCIQQIQQADQMQRDAGIMLNGMIRHFLSMHKIECNWRLADNKRELILERAPAKQ